MFDPPPSVVEVVAVSCSDPDEPITVRYFQFSSDSDMYDAFDDYYRSGGSGWCRDGEAGTQAYDQGGDPVGRYSCYRSNEGNNVLSWTHEPTEIMAVAFSPTLTYPDLVDWWQQAGPL